MLKATQRLVHIARILKSNGTDGELVMSFRGVGLEDIDIKEPVFIIFDGSPVPFFIQNFAKRGKGRYLVRLNDICNLKDAEEIVERNVYAEPENIAHYEDEEDLSSFVGWILYDNNTSADGRAGANCKKVGTITGILDISNNPCIEVETETGTGTVMIPLHEDLIVSTDPSNKEIIMDIPHGLI